VASSGRWRSPRPDALMSRPTPLMRGEPSHDLVRLVAAGAPIFSASRGMAGTGAYFLSRPAIRAAYLEGGSAPPHDPPCTQ
jgi:hypothetical protein